MITAADIIWAAVLLTAWYLALLGTVHWMTRDFK